MAKSVSPKNKKVANSLLAVSSAAVLAVYSAGYARTRSAADQFDQRAAERRPAAPGPGRAGSPTAPFQGTGLNAPAAGSGRAMLPANGEAREAIDIKPSLLASVNPLPSGEGLTAGPAAPASSLHSISHSARRGPHDNLLFRRTRTRATGAHPHPHPRR